MTIPTAPDEGGGNKISFVVVDVTGTNTPGLLSGRRYRTVNLEKYAELDVYPTSGNLENGNRQLTGSTALVLSATSVPAQGVTIKARAANANTLYVGKSDVTADTTEATGGYPLEPGESVVVPCRDLDEVYIRGTSGEGVAFMGSID